MKVSFIIAVLLADACFAAEKPQSLTTASGGAESRWWPTQAVQKTLVRLTNDPGASTSHAMTAQSVAGIAANAVNEGRGDEMVWVDSGNVDAEDWLARTSKRQPQVEMRGEFGLWPLIERYAKRDIIKGYILYRADTSKGQLNEYRRGMDCSVNVATSLAGVLNGIIVDETLEPQARRLGLKLLLDARDKTQAWCFETYKSQFNRAMLCTQDPRKPHVRDLAIAQKAFTTYGDDAPLPAVLGWLAPLSPILGWNGGDEFNTTEMSSRWAHIQTATDWCINLPILMAGTENAGQSRVKNFDPRTIDWKDSRSAVSFISTDGDNVQWFEGNFFRSADSRNYWSNPERGKIPFGWSCCFAHLAQLCPGAIDYAVSTQSPNDTFIEWGGGYYFPDLFATQRPDRWALLAQHARRTWTLMEKSNTRIIGFNVARFDSPDARRAYEVFAGQTGGLLAILVFQYDAYEAGGGQTFWVKDRNGVDVPVVSARYSIWSQANRPRAGTPAKVAREIRQTVEHVPSSELPRYDWVIAHVWSYFKPAPGIDEHAEDMPQENAAANGGVRGYAPATWCAARLPSTIRSVSPEELIWRIRMKHNPAETQRLIAEWRR
jgi:hypothetical protein